MLGFYDNCKKSKPGKKGFSNFKRHSSSVKYYTSESFYSKKRKSITFTDKLGRGKFKLKEIWDWHL